MRRRAILNAVCITLFVLWFVLHLREYTRHRETFDIYFRRPVRYMTRHSLKGFPPDVCNIRWAGRRGMMWSELVPQLRHDLDSLPAPDVVIIHLGSNKMALVGEALYSHRMNTVLAACRNQNITAINGPLPNKPVVDEKDHLIYCPVAKIASSFWKKVIQVSSEIKPGLDMYDFRGVDDDSLPLLNSYPVDNIQIMLKNHTTFLFVREPYSRLLACYIDKLFTVNPSYWKLGQKIIRKFRPRASDISLTCGHDVTFPEFITYIISDLERSVTAVNKHWEPIYKSCSPCQIQYDIIGKMETFSQDFKFFFSKIWGKEDEAENMEQDSESRRLSFAFNSFFTYFESVKACMNFTDALHRFLKKEKIRGIIKKSVEIPVHLIVYDVSVKAELSSFLLDENKRTNDKKIYEMNRNEALVEAYSIVPIEDMFKLQRLYKLDFLLFGYDPNLPMLYDTNVRNGNTNKFYFQ